MKACQSCQSVIHEGLSDSVDYCEECDILEPMSETNPRGRPNLNPDEETEKVLLRIPASAHDQLVDAAEALGVLYNGKPAKGTLARRVVMAWLALSDAERAAFLEPTDR